MVLHFVVSDRTSLTCMYVCMYVVERMREGKGWREMVNNWCGEIKD